MIVQKYGAKDVYKHIHNLIHKDNGATDEVVLDSIRDYVSTLEYVPTLLDVVMIANANSNTHEGYILDALNDLASLYLTGE